MTEWNKTKEKKPNVGYSYLCVVVSNHERYIDILSRTNDKKYPWIENTYEGYDYTDDEVTHWMPLPEPPKEDKA